MEQPVSQPLARQIRIEQFEIVDGVDQRAAFDPGLVLRQHVRRGAGRRVAGMQIGLPRALGRSRQELQQDAAGAPMPARAVLAGAKLFGDGKPHARRNLLRAGKIFMRGLFEVAAFERHEPLVAAHLRALVDGHGEMAVTEQLAGRGRAVGNRASDARGIEAGAGPHFAGRGEIDHQHAHRPVALGLQDEAAVDFERRAEHDREHDRLAEELGHRRRIIVAAQDGVDRRPEPHDAAAQIERLDRERQDGVVEPGLGGRANRNGEYRDCSSRQI